MIGTLLVARERRKAVKLAVALIVLGKPGQAQFVLQRSVLRQARIEGVRDGVA